MTIRKLREAVEADALPTMDEIGALWDESQPFAYSTLMPLTVKAFNGSLDAALALMQAVLPGWECQISTRKSKARAELGPPEFLVWKFRTTADTPARALLLAILKALEAQHG